MTYTNSCSWVHECRSCEIQNEMIPEVLKTLAGVFPGTIEEITADKKRVSLVSGDKKWTIFKPTAASWKCGIENYMVSTQVNEETTDDDAAPAMLSMKKGMVRSVTIWGKNEKDEVYGFSVRFFASFDEKTFKHVVSEVVSF